MIRIAALLAIGFVTWMLVFLRSHAFGTRKSGLLCGIIFIDEAIGMTTAVWLARNGVFLEILAVAAGGALAALLSVKLLRRNKNVNVHNNQR